MKCSNSLGIIKFFAHYCQLSNIDLTSVCTLYPDFLQTVLIAITQPEDEIVWGVALDTFALFGSTVKGREALDLYNEETIVAIKALGQFVMQSKSELRVHSLKALSLIMSCDEGSHDDVSRSLSCQWYLLAVPNFVAVVMVIAKQPFPDLRCASLNFLLTISRWRWGQKEIGACPGFMEYLLDRSTERDKISKELKYSIIRTLAASPHCCDVLGNPIYIKLQQYMREGPFFVVTEPASVATED